MRGLLDKHEPYCKLPHGGSECACPPINTTKRPEHWIETSLHDALHGAVDLGNEVIRLRKTIRNVYDLLSGEFYAEALGELEDAMQADVDELKAQLDTPDGEAK